MRGADKPDMTFTPFPSGSRREAVADVLSEHARLWWARLNRSDFMRGARISAVATYALTLRAATTRFGGRSAGAVWVLVTPMMQLGIMILLFSYLGRGPGAGDSLVIFFVTGIMPVFLMRQAISGGGGTLRGGGGMMAFPQISSFEVVNSRVLLELIVNFMVVVLFMIISKAFLDLPFTEWVKDPFELLGALTMLAYFVYAASFLSAEIGRMWQQWTDVTRLVSRALFFTSGVWYTMGSLPLQLQSVVKYNPLAHIIEWIRDASIHGFSSDHFDPSYPFWFATVCLFLGLVIDWIYRLGGYDVPKT
jgi:capsular polysaccharide transport system permease protein